MFVKNRDYKNCILSKTFYVGDIVGLEKPEDAHITLTEVPTIEEVKMTSLGDDTVKVFEWFYGVLPLIITDHDFYTDENTKMSNEELVELIKDKTALSAYLFKEFAHFLESTQMKTTSEG